MAIELKDICLHCRDCSLAKYQKPNPFSLKNLSKEQFDSENDKASFDRFRGCKTLFLFHNEIIDWGVDSFVIKDNSDNYVIKIYTHRNLEEVLGYKKEVEDLIQKHNGQIVECSGKEYSIQINPILGIKETDNGCVATISSYIPGENARDMYKNSQVLEDTDNITGYEKVVSQVIGRYIDPSNLKVDEDNRIIHITDIGWRIVKR